MTNYLLYHNNSCETGRALAQALGIESGTELPERRFDKLIRWGNRASVRFSPVKVLNKMEAMNNASNKERALRVMEEQNIPHPPRKERFEGKLLLARKSEHMHGSGAYFVTSQFDFDNAKRVGCVAFMEFVPTKREFRVHVIRGEPVFVYERILPNEPNSLNIRNDWNEERKEIREVPREIIDASVDCVRKMGLDFGAVDIGLSVNNKPYIYEVNTAPGLVDGERKKPSFRVYEEKFRAWLRE